ncbi:MAG: hypothetical protein PGN08_02960 [Sphingomonas taxi]
MKTHIVLAGFASLIAVAPLAAQSTTDPAPAQPKAERKICKRLEQTGSRMGGGSKVCHTATEWKQIEADSFSRNVNGSNNMRGNGQN